MNPFSGLSDQVKMQVEVKQRQRGFVRGEDARDHGGGCTPKMRCLDQDSTANDYSRPREKSYAFSIVFIGGSRL
jgi:hypothetical protein